MNQPAQAQPAQEYPFQGQTGYFAGVTAETYYLEMQQCSQSWLSYFNPRPKAGLTPAHFYHEYLAPDAKREMTDALRFGQAFHLCILEPDEFRKRVQWHKEHKTTRSKGFQDAAAQLPERMLLLPEAWKDQLFGMLEALLADADTRALLEMEADNEVTLVWQDKETGIECKARMDRAARKFGLPIDFKTSADASEDGFEKSVRDYNYHVQEAFYCAGWEAVFGEKPRAFAFPVVEKDSPYLTNRFALSPEAREAGEYIFRRNLRIYADCLEKNHFPGYGPGTKKVFLPDWYSRKLENDME